MLDARTLYQSGKLDEAIQALGAEVRDNPTDAQRRTFLFELLCFAGDYDRAEKQLAVLGQGGSESQMGALLYHAALHAERLRKELEARFGLEASRNTKLLYRRLLGQDASRDSSPERSAQVTVD